MTPAELQKFLRKADPAAVLVSPRILERVIREDCQLPNMYWNIPHAKSYVCDRQGLFRHAEQADLELEPDQLLPDTVILLARPDPEELSNIESKLVLLKYWRRLFHSRVHIALGALDGAGPLTAEGLRERIAEIGRTEFEEIRAVLCEDHYLPPDPDDRTTYIEFAAVYLELRFFAANLLPNYFPGMRDHERIDRLLTQDVDAATLFACTRLSDASDPIMTADTRSDESQEAYWKLVHSAQADALAGNTVGAAIQRMRASRIAPAALTQSTRSEAEADIAHLSKRLAAALTLTEAETAEWTLRLTQLLDKADQGVRPTEARVLEDLQKVCLDHEENVYTLDLVEYLMSGGKRPIKRPLPSQRLVRITKHLHSASQKLGEVRLSDSDRNHLARLVGSALHKSEEGLRGRFEPVLVTALVDVGLQAQNPIERAAFDKMVGELLDRITSYGYLTFAELRDTISRNQFKLADPSEPEDFLLGDPLIRLDRRLAALLDGVYRPSEFYTRWLERGTSLLFGTWWGRPLCTFVLMPFTTAWVCLHLLGLFLLWVARSTASYEETPILTTVGQALYGPQVRHLADGKNGLTIIPQLLVWHLVGLFAAAFFLIALIHVASFRRRCRLVLRAVWRGLRLVFWDAPLRVVPLATLRAHHRHLGLSARLLVWDQARGRVPAVLLAAVQAALVVGLAFYVGLALLINSRVGRAISESISDALVNVGTMVRAGLIPGLLRFFLHLFKQMLELVEYVLFVVDEWLRFRSGDGRASLILRTMLGGPVVSLRLPRPLLYGGAHRARHQPGQASPLDHGRQGALAHLSAPDHRDSADPERGDWRLAGRRSHHLSPLLAAGRLRLPDLGDEGKLEPVPGQPLQGPASGRGGWARGNGARTAAAGLPFRHRAAAVRAAAPGGTDGDEDAQLARRTGVPAGSRRDVPNAEELRCPRNDRAAGAEPELERASGRGGKGSPGDQPVAHRADPRRLSRMSRRDRDQSSRQLADSLFAPPTAGWKS